MITSASFSTLAIRGEEEDLLGPSADADLFVGISETEAALEIAMIRLAQRRAFRSPACIWSLRESIAACAPP